MALTKRERYAILRLTNAVCPVGVGTAEGVAARADILGALNVTESDVAEALTEDAADWDAPTDDADDGDGDDATA